MLQLTSGETPFDGSKTIGLANLLSAIIDYQQKTVSNPSLGEYSFELNVVAP
jgi:hypothetical protein